MQPAISFPIQTVSESCTSTEVRKNLGNFFSPFRLSPMEKTKGLHNRRPLSHHGTVLAATYNTNLGFPIYKWHMENGKEEADSSFSFALNDWRSLVKGMLSNENLRLFIQGQLSLANDSHRQKRSKACILYKAIDIPGFHPFPNQSAFLPYFPLFYLFIWLAKRKN